MGCAQNIGRGYGKVYGLSSSPEEALQHRKLAQTVVAKVENNEQTCLSSGQCGGVNAGAWPGLVARPGLVAGSEWEHGGGTPVARG